MYIRKPKWTTKYPLALIMVMALSACAVEFVYKADSSSWSCNSAPLHSFTLPVPSIGRSRGAAFPMKNHRQCR